MHCENCNGKVFVKTLYNYNECKRCGRINYDNEHARDKSGAAGEMYFAIGAVAVVFVIAALILIFFTASGKRESAKSAGSDMNISAPKK